MYDPGTGRTFDGVAPDGTVNRNSGAESTIHGLLSMLALDAAPDVAAAARVADPTERRTWRLIEAEDARREGDATVVTPDSAWTGESSWSGGGYVSLAPGASLSFDVPAGPDRLVLPVVDRIEDADGGSTAWSAGGHALGTLPHGGAGAQGVSEAPGVLEADTLPRELAAGGDTTTLRATAGESAHRVRVDAVLVQPLIERMVLEGGGHGRALLRSFDTERRVVSVAVPGGASSATVATYDGSGRLVRRVRARGAAVDALVVPGGFTVVER